MDRLAAGLSDSAEQTLETELQIVREAIAMVEGGSARRIVVASLRFGEQLIKPARRMALPAGVRIGVLRTTDAGGTDIAFERIGDD